MWKDPPYPVTGRGPFEVRRFSVKPRRGAHGARDGEKAREDGTFPRTTNGEIRSNRP